MLMIITGENDCRPKEDLIMAPDRPQSPDYIDMISPQQKIEKQLLAKICQMQAKSMFKKHSSQFKLQCISLMLRWSYWDDIDLVIDNGVRAWQIDFSLLFNCVWPVLPC